MNQRRRIVVRGLDSLLLWDDPEQRLSLCQRLFVASLDIFEMMLDKEVLDCQLKGIVRTC